MNERKRPRKKVRVRYMTKGRMAEKENMKKGKQRKEKTAQDGKEENMRNRI
jgi:hypothetical protein